MGGKRAGSGNRETVEGDRERTSTSAFPSTSRFVIQTALPRTSFHPPLASRLAERHGRWICVTTAAAAPLETHPGCGPSPAKTSTARQGLARDETWRGARARRYAAHLQHLGHARGPGVLSGAGTGRVGFAGARRDHLNPAGAAPERGDEANGPTLAGGPPAPRVNLGLTVLTTPRDDCCRRMGGAQVRALAPARLGHEELAVLR